MEVAVQTIGHSYNMCHQGIQCPEYDFSKTDQITWKLETGEKILQENVCEFSGEYPIKIVTREEKMVNGKLYINRYTQVTTAIRIQLQISKYSIVNEKTDFQEPGLPRITPRLRRRQD